MPRSSDRVTRATRLAANAAATAVVAFGVLWLLTTQVAAIRALSPFADDPWDAFATYAAVFLPVVAGATWIRSLGHRGPVLEPATAGRIRWGAGLSAAIVLVATLADAQAIVANGFPTDAGTAAPLIVWLVGVTAVAAALGVALVGRAGRIAGDGCRSFVSSSENAEPDVVDDLLGLAADAATAVGLRGPVERAAARFERFLENSALSPRRHRLIFGVVVAVAAAAAFDVWHTIREGPPASLVVPLIFGVLLASGVLAIYLGTLRPLRLLRPPRS